MILTMRLSLFTGMLGIAFLLFPIVTLADCDQQTSLRVTRILHQLQPELEAGHDQQALTLLEEFAHSYPQEKHYLLDYHRGNIYVAMKRHEEALAAYGAALSLCPDTAALWQNQGAVAWDLKRYDIAADSLMRAYSLQPNEELFFNATVALLYAGRIQEAADRFEQLIERGGERTSDQWLETYSGLCLSHDLVSRSLEKLKAWQPFFAERAIYWRLLAMTYLQHRDYAKAAAGLKVYASFVPINPADKRLLADLLLQIQLPLEAAPLYEDLLQEQPQDMMLHQQLIVSYRLGLRPETALKAIGRALDVQQTQQLLRSKAEVSFELGHYQEAFETFARLLEVNPDNGTAYLYQGYSALRMGREDLARSALIKAARFPDNKAQANRMLSSLGAR